MNQLHYKFTKPSKLIASFDLDNTLITIKSGKRFSKNEGDYSYSDKN